MTELYFLTIKETARIPENYFREHFPRRLERAEKFRFEEDRLRCLGAGVLLTAVLGVREEDLRTGPQGKLYLPGNGRKFNVSHSGEYIVLAVSDEEIGVDIEETAPGHTDMAKRVFQPEELCWMNRAGSEESERNGRFYCLWTLKESVMKQTGLGLSLPPDSFSVLPLLHGDSLRIRTGEPEGSLYAVSLELPGPGDGSGDFLRRKRTETAAKPADRTEPAAAYRVAVCTEHPEKHIFSYQLVWNTANYGGLETIFMQLTF